MRAAAAGVLAACVLLAGHGDGVRADAVPDFARYVALGDGWTAGFMNGNLYDGATAFSRDGDVETPAPERTGQGESWPLALAGSMGTDAAAPLVSWPGRGGRRALRRRNDACAYDGSTLQINTPLGDPGAREDPSVRATVVAVPFQKVGDATTRKWSLDPSSPGTIDTDEDMVLGLPWAALGAPPRTQLETALALAPTFATVWLGVEDALAPARVGLSAPLTTPHEFEDALRRVVAALAAAGAQGAVATVPDVTALPYFMGQRDLKAFLDSHRGAGEARPTNQGMRIVLGVAPSSFVFRRRSLFERLDQIAAGVEHSAPLDPNMVLAGAEAKRLRARLRRFNASIEKVAAENGWALVRTDALVDRWRRDGVVVGGTKLTTAFFGGLFDLDGLYPSPTAHALIAAEFAKAIDAKYGTSLGAPDAAAVLAVDPLAPCR